LETANKGNSQDQKQHRNEEPSTFEHKMFLIKPLVKHRLAIPQLFCPQLVKSVIDNLPGSISSNARQ
jgi:hypothetical protein